MATSIDGANERLLPAAAPNGLPSPPTAPAEPPAAARADSPPRDMDVDAPPAADQPLTTGASTPPPPPAVATASAFAPDGDDGKLPPPVNAPTTEARPPGGEEAFGGPGGLVNQNGALASNPVSLYDVVSPIASMADAPADAFMAMSHAHQLAPQPRHQRLTAYACLRFPDGAYYMHTYAVILGRNVELARRDKVRLAKAERLRNAGQETAAEDVIHGRKRKRRHGARSVISEAGGIVSAPIASMPFGYRTHMHNSATHSTSSSSHRPGDESPDADVQQAPQEVIMQAFAEMPDQLETRVTEDPYETPLVPIHPRHRITEMTGPQGPNGISRQHAKISFNAENGSWELEVLGHNGLWLDDNFARQGQVLELQHEDEIRIGMVEMTFELPEITHEQQARHESGSRPMSFAFENGEGELDTDDYGNSSESEHASVNPSQLFVFPQGALDSFDEDMVGSEDDSDEYSSSPQPLRQKQAKKKHKDKRKDQRKDKHKDKAREKYKDKHKEEPRKSLKVTLKLKKRHLADVNPVPTKEEKASMKRKAGVADSDDSPDEPLLKKTKSKPKELEKELLKEKDKEEKKGKAPMKSQPSKPVSAPATAPAKSPAPEARPPQAAVEKKPEPLKHIMSESPTIARKPAAEGREPAEDGVEQEGTITAEMIKAHGLPESLLGYVMEKRKGPGRPPKDGVMSKRQRAQLVKQGKEIEKARAAGIDPADLPITTAKPKVARPRKDSNALGGDGGDDDIRETTEAGDGTVISGDKKTAKPNKPPRTPSPEMKIEDYTEEQLQRPSANYVVLIHEAISSSKTGQMNLQQIYNYIERKYPWYKFKTTTSGWQSSVRHNLGQHNAFVKGDKEGKGFNWRINPAVSIEKERRKRQVSPQANQVPRPGYYPPPNGYPPYAHHGYYHGMHGQPPNGAPPPPPNVDSVQPRLPPSLARNSTSGPAAQGPSNPSPYASPWAGGNATPNGQPPRPFPQPNPHAPSVNPSGVPSGQYGVLLPTNAPHGAYGGYPPAGPYGNQPTPAGASPYPNAPNRAYTPYANAAASNAPNTAPHMSLQHSQQVTNFNQGLPRPPPGPPQPHPSGRYPISTNPVLITQLEAFRETYLKVTPLPKAAEEKKMDNVIRAVVDPNQRASLSTEERELYTRIGNIPTVKQFASMPEVQDGSAAQQQQNNPAKPNTTQGPANEANKTTAPVMQVAAASSAAAMAASSAAAVAASALPSHVPTSGPSPSGDAPKPVPPAYGPPQPGHPSQAPSTMPQNGPAPYQPPHASAVQQANRAPSTVAPGPALSSALGQASAASSQPPSTTTASDPHKYMPNMGGAPPAQMQMAQVPPSANKPSTGTTAPAPVQNLVSRPSVEPLTPVGGTPTAGTPVPGSPAPQSSQTNPLRPPPVHAPNGPPAAANETPGPNPVSPSGEKKDAAPAPASSVASPANAPPAAPQSATGSPPQ